MSQTGTGQTTLTGNNSYTGTTTVSNGYLFVDGDQSAATGLTSVASGARLSGSGTIGGDVTVANNAVFAPGYQPFTPATLTINGNLSLSNTSNVFYNLVQAGVAGGALNDLTVIHGDLALDGVINVLDPGTDLGPGVYRIFDYNGTLTDNGLTIGSYMNNQLQPTHAMTDFSVQTAIPGQVNLVNGAGLDLTYWDGTGNAGTKNNDVIEGGNGLWRVAGVGATSNWTDSDGTLNAPWADGQFAIFTAASGTVTVTSAFGDVHAYGMQFMTNGYVVTGDAINLVDSVTTPENTSVIRVGDGTQGGVAVTATINAVLSGATRLEKTDLGTLVLGGINTYSGGTAIDGGVVQVAQNANLGDVAGALSLDNGTLRTTGTFTTLRATTLDAGGGTFDTLTGTTFTLGTAVGGSGRLTKTGAGTTILATSNTYSGGTVISAGTLQLGTGLAAGSITGNVTNNGTLAFNRNDTTSFGGTISGSGALRQIGSGTTILTATNSYTGGTTISSGTLQLGNGGATGSITGNVVNNGALVFNRSNVYTFGGTISGAGSLEQTGSGQTVLTGTNSYTGPTTVSNGYLFVNGNQSAATGLTSVASGARLSGNGTLGGDVTVANGGMLAPGYQPFTPATLTINGNLALSGGSTLFYNVVEAGVAGGQYNDLTVVHGNLALDGTINVLDQGQTLGPGVYRIFNYDGTLTNNGLTIGAFTPDPANPGVPLTGFIVQTAIAGQVNLINTAGLTLTYWDGEGTAGTKNNNQIEGGNGTWRNPAAADSSWTNPNGSVNAPWSTGGHAIFAATAGVVTVDDSDGPILLTGMDFTSDGYLIQGDALNLIGSANVRVGDGTLAGAAMTATINSVLAGGAILTKSDFGTLVLGGANTYSGGTVINEGVVQVASDANLGATAGALRLNGGTLSTTASFTSARDVIINSDGGTFDTLSGTALTLGNPVTGSGALAKSGAGSLILAMENTYSGGTTINAGTLQLGNGGTTGSITGNVTNNGTLAFNRSNTYTFSGIVSGSGTLRQTGSGTTILTAANTYSGGTTISNGVLQLGNGGATGSITGNVTNNGALVFNRSNTYTFGGTVSGSGALRQTGSGTTILTATNTYSGGTTISNGTLQLGNGGATGSITGDVTNNGALVFNRSNTVTFDGQILGSGSLTQQGTGTTILTSNNTYSGGTTISAGTLQLGNGGGTGSIIGDVTNNGTLAFDRADVLPVVGDISGTGNLIQRGTGVTVLLGNNSYGGTTQITSGALYVDGDQSAATGLTTAASGGTLGGTGIIGGDAVIASGATLSPGSVGTAPGTLTIRGNLALGSGSTLDYNFGQANSVGGALNDLTSVQGNLVLDGTLNVATTQGGAFDPGIYRIISYAGTLTNNGLTIGTIPSPDFFLQTAVDHQVNLINTAGLALNYWDGDAGPKDNGVINGGNGVWQGSAGNNNWTNEIGVPNAPWSSQAFAIFMAASGTVTIDNSSGSVEAAGMQFASDGYRVQGDPLTLVGTAAVIRVGDGAATGAGYTATINAAITGGATLVKTDRGTLVLDGANSYTGGTAVKGGVLEISADNNLGAGGTGLSLDGGTLRTSAIFTSTRATVLESGGGTFETATGTTFTLNGVAGGAGSLTKTGAGILVLGQNNSYSGGTVISAGTLQLGNGGTSGSITGDVTNNGILAFNRSNTLTFGGIVSGSGALAQQGTGTTILTGNSTYSGGTTISAGTLQLGNGGVTGSITGNVTNNGTLAFNRSDIATFSGIISGTGAVRQIGSGTTILTAANSYSGATIVTTGTLRAGAAGTFSPQSLFTVQAAGTLDLGGFEQTIPGLTNGGMVRTGGAPGTDLTVAGNYTGAGGTLAFNTVLGDDSAVSDRLVINGGTASGSTSIAITNIGGQGAKTIGDGIRLVDAVNGATTMPTAFSLGAPAVAGPYEYSLYRGGLSGASADDWFLRSILNCALSPNFPQCQNNPAPPAYRPETSLYTAIPSLALNYGNALLDSLDERMGGRAVDPIERVNAAHRLAWGRIVGLAGSRDGGTSGIYGNGGADYDNTIFALQAGMNLYHAGRANGGNDIAGFYVAYGQTRADVTHFDRMDAGTDTLDGWTLGGYWTHSGASGWYLDTVVQGTWYDIDASGRLPDMKTDGVGLGLSLEGGYPIRFGNGVVLEPQAQLTYQMIAISDGRDSGARIRFDDVQSLVGHLGLRLSRSWDLEPAGANAEPRQAALWFRTSLVNEFLGQPETQFSSDDGYVPFRSEMKGAGFRLDAGLDAEMVTNVSLYGSITFQQRFDGDDHVFGGKLGIKARF